MAIPAKSLKKQFKQGINEYLNKMGRDIFVFLPPYEVTCPNCFWDSVREKSSNVYNIAFVRPVNIFPGTAYQLQIYPVPFNITTVTGVQYDPDIIDPHPIIATLCPVCKGEGKLVADNKFNIKALVTWNPKEEFLETSAGREGEPICRIKTFNCNYGLCRDALYFMVDGVKCDLHIPPKLKGLGADHLTEFYLITTAVNQNVSTTFDTDTRLNNNTNGLMSEQATSGTPTIPPSVPGDDVW